MTNLNKRIVRVGIEGIGGGFTFFEDLDIRCQGEKWAGPESSMCRIQISNLTRDQKNFILTVASPMQINLTGRRTPLLVTLDVGRENVFDPFRLFQGYCYASYVTMPPDIGIVLESTVQSLAASTMMDMNWGALADLRTIAQSVATTYGLTLNFTASNKQVANFHYTGGLNDALQKLSMSGLVTVFVDNTILYVTDTGKKAGEASAFDLNILTGMVGIPEVCETGVNARCLIRPELQLGGEVNVQSEINPAVNGNYLVSHLKYEIANRDDPFWYEMLLTNANYLLGNQ